jgi:hypothetical protein
VHYDPRVKPVALVATLCACSAAPSQATAPRPVPVTATPWAVAEPPPRRPEPERDGIERDLLRIGEELAQLRPRGDAPIVRGPRGLADAGDLADSDYWSPCARAVVLQHPEPARRALAVLIDTYATSCDADGRLVLERPRDLAGRERRARSGVAIVGTLAARDVDVALRVTYCGAVGDVDHVVLGQWTSQRLELLKDGDGCVYGDIAMTRPFARVLRGLVDGPASVRIEGAHGYDVVALDDDALRVLRIGLDAFQTLVP